MPTLRFPFALVTAERPLFQGDVTLVNVPGERGDYGVLAGHAPMATTLRAGILDVFVQDESAPPERFFVAGGFGHVTDNGFTVLAEGAVSLKDLDRTQVDRDLAAVREALAAATILPVEKATLESRRALLEAQRQAVG